MVRKTKILFWLFLALAGVALWLALDREPKEQMPQYRFGKIHSGDITSEVLTTGRLSPLVMVQVGSQASGTIQFLKADFNQQVKKGDVIAQIEPSLFRARVAQAEANLQSAQAARDKAQVALRDAQRQLERTRRLRKQNMISESEMDDAAFNHEQAKVEHKVQLAKLAEARATLQLARVNLTHTTIYAPIDGVVISRDVDVGQTVAASLQAPTLFTIARDLTRMQIEAYVDEAYIGMVGENQTVNFSVYAYPDRTYQGQLTQVRLNPDAEEEVVKYNCIIEVENQDLSLKPGMTATVSIQTGARKDILKVSNDALRFIPDMPAEQLNELRTQLNLSEGQSVIWTLSNDGPRPHKVSTGLSTDSETEIAAADIKNGMSVIIGAHRAQQSAPRKMGLKLF